MIARLIHWSVLNRFFVVLDALALVFAAIASTHRRTPITPGSVRSLAEARS